MFIIRGGPSIYRGEGGAIAWGGGGGGGGKGVFIIRGGPSIYRGEGGAIAWGGGGGGAKAYIAGKKYQWFSL